MEVILPTPKWISTTVRRAATERVLKAGQHLFRVGDRTAGLYEVVDGKVRLVRVDRSGREAILQAAERAILWRKRRFFHRFIIATRLQQLRPSFGCIREPLS